MKENVYAVVILAKCCKSGKVFGMRAEKDAERWLITWAFPISEKSAGREGYDRTTVKGDIVFVEGYPGCPYCGGSSLALCVCGHMNCVTVDDDMTFTCEWCGAKGKLGRYSGEAFSAGMDA